MKFYKHTINGDCFADTGRHVWVWYKEGGYNNWVILNSLTCLSIKDVIKDSKNIIDITPLEALVLTGNQGPKEEKIR